MIVLIRKEQPAMDLNTSSDQSQCPLLTLLPAELRNQIYQLLLVQRIRHIPTARLLLGDVESHDDKKKKSRFCANILQTCKQIHGEGTPILYGENIFSAHPSLLATLPSFLVLKEPRRIALSPVTCPRVMKFIRRYFIFVRLDVDPRFSSRQAEESFNGVEELEIEVFQAMYGGCDFSVLKLFEGVRGVGKVNITGSLGDRKYADWLTACMQAPIGAEVRPFWEEWVGGVQVWHAWQAGSR